ncbi:MAG: hypothetical protein P1U65_07720 [Minwuia sp.]|nr:hypothetical protein [Minwuia sp.]
MTDTSEMIRDGSDEADRLYQMWIDVLDHWQREGREITEGQTILAHRRALNIMLLVLNACHV